MAKNIYFGHSFTFANTPGMFFILSHGGIINYGRALMLIEMLGNDDNKIDLTDTPFMFMVSKRLECTPEEFYDIVSIFTASGLFEITDNVLSSRIVTEAFQFMEAKSEIYRQNALKKHNTKINNDQKQQQAIASNSKQQQTTADNGLQRQAIASKDEQTSANVSKPLPIEIEIEKETEIEKEKEQKRKKKDNEDISSADADSSPDGAGASSASGERITASMVNQIRDDYNSILSGLKPEIKVINEKRSKAVKFLLKRYGREVIVEVFKKVLESDFLLGRTAKPFNGCDFDWIINESNFVKIYEGKYDNGSYVKEVPKSIHSLFEGVEAHKEGQRADVFDSIKTEVFQ